MTETDQQADSKEKVSRGRISKGKQEEVIRGELEQSRGWGKEDMWSCPVNIVWQQKV